MLSSWGDADQKLEQIVVHDVVGELVGSTHVTSTSTDSQPVRARRYVELA
jgi:hypothetical protein